MSKFSLSAALAAVAAVSFVAPAISAPAPEVTRKVLINEPSQIANNQIMLIEVQIPVGGREGKHTHPSTLVVQVQEGALTLEHDGRAARTYNAGESFFVEAGKVHEGINRGNVPVKALASTVVEKGKPVTTQVQ